MAPNTRSLTAQNLQTEEPILLFSSSNPIPTETIFLSNIDQAVTFPVETVFFYEVPPNKAPSSTVDIAEKVKKAVSEVLLKPYYFMAGRLNFNSESNRLELICNNAGVLFVNSKAKLSIDDLGNLARADPTFRHLIYRPGLYKNLANTPVFTIQVTRFACSGFSVGFLTNHAVLDGKSAGEMFQNLASACRGEDLIYLNINSNRSCIKSRNPPQILFSHDEYVKLEKTRSLASSFTSRRRTLPSPRVFSTNYTHKIFPFTPQMLDSLKAKAKNECSTFEALVAHVWRSRTKATFDDMDKDSTVLFAVDIRDKLSPPIPDNFAGNAVVTGFAKAKARDLVEKPLGFGVEMVKRGKERVSSDEYIRSVIDWLEVYEGIPATCDGTFYVSAWWKLPFWKVDFGLGKPKHAGPIVSGNDEFVLFLSGPNGLGINVWMGLEKGKMERFSTCVFEILEVGARGSPCVK